MTKCKYCDESIKWEWDETTERWMPIDPETDDRHDCSAYEGGRSSSSFTAECKYCDEERRRRRK